MFSAGGFSFPLGKKTYVMGILNYTPDSFSDGGRFFTPEAAAERALEIEKQGADIIDIGANSTRPGSVILSESEELERLRDVLGALRCKVSLPVSVDTFYPSCASFALENGAVIINDVSGTFNPVIASLVREKKCGYIVMHNPCGADGVAQYPDGASVAVRQFFLDCLEKAAQAGLDFSHLCLDPGFGFGKSREDDREVLGNLGLIKFKGIALLAGVSRKRMTSLGDDKPLERETATAAANALAIAGGADIIRVHDVANAVKTAAFTDRITRR